MFQDADYQGSTVIGEKGQLVIPADLRKKFDIQAGDKFLVLAGERLGAWGILLVKAEVVTKVVEGMLGGELGKCKIQDILDTLKEGDAK